MRKLILKNNLSPGDVLVLTAAVRDIHRRYPAEWTTDVRTSVPSLWQNNPFLTPIENHDPTAEFVVCHYPLIHRSNQNPEHFLKGYIKYLNEILNLDINLTDFHGDIHLSHEERQYPEMISRYLGKGAPYWLVAAGGKHDFTIKWWDRHRYQEIVDHFRGRINFVQVGNKGDYHPRLNEVIDLRGQTDIRELIQLVHHAEGVLCPVTFLMHLAAATPHSKSSQRQRACVVIAGGREPVMWEAYPTHQFIDTIGQLSCCATEGCWRSRTVPLGDGSPLDEDHHICIRVKSGLPECMDLITATDVIERIEPYVH